LQPPAWIIRASGLIDGLVRAATGRIATDSFGLQPALAAHTLIDDHKNVNLKTQGVHNYTEVASLDPHDVQVTSAAAVSALDFTKGCPNHVINSKILNRDENGESDIAQAIQPVTNTRDAKEQEWLVCPRHAQMIED
jgi:hypothetical protein